MLSLIVLHALFHFTFLDPVDHDGFYYIVLGCINFCLIFGLWFIMDLFPSSIQFQSYVALYPYVRCHMLLQSA